MRACYLLAHRRYQQLRIHDTRISSLLADASLLRDRLGLCEDSEQLGAAAMAYLAGWTSELGLNEAKVHG